MDRHPCRKRESTQYRQNKSLAPKLPGEYNKSCPGRQGQIHFPAAHIAWGQANFLGAFLGPQASSLPVGGWAPFAGCLFASQTGWKPVDPSAGKMPAVPGYLFPQGNLLAPHRISKSMNAFLWYFLLVFSEKITLERRGCVRRPGL